MVTNLDFGIVNFHGQIVTIWPNRLQLFLTSIIRAVALGLTADDMIAVQEYTETLKVKRQPESVATVIKREVAKEESHMRVGRSDFGIIIKSFQND